MKKISKAKVILDAFTKESPLDEEILQFRRTKCEGCPYNSKNNADMKLMERIRGNTLGDFCTLCKCNIEEKTGAPTEHCALDAIDETPIWNAIKVVTQGQDLDLTNNTPKLTAIDLHESGDYFVIDFGDISRKERMNKGGTTSRFDETFGFSLSSSDNTFDIVSVNASCGCTTPSFVKNGSGFDFLARISKDIMGISGFSVNLTINYIEKGVHKKVILKVIGKVI